MNHTPLQPRHTGRAIVIHDGQLLLMERWRPGLHYFSIPGGGIEANETPEQAAIREIMEETTISVTIDREVLQMRDGDNLHHIFLCNYESGEPSLPDDAPEALLNNPDNRFRPGWFPIESISALTFTYWQPLKQPLVDALRNGFGDDITIVSANNNA